MPKLNNLVKFLGGFVAVYLLISVLHLWSPVRKAHVLFFNASEQLAFNMFHPKAHASFKSYKPEYSEGAPVGDYDFAIFVYDIADWKGARNKKNAQVNFVLNQNSKLVSIGPFTFFLALLLMTPLGWRRKLISFLIGTFLINIVLALKFSFLFYQSAELPLGSGLWGALAKLLGNSFRTHEFMMIAVLIVWVLVAIRQKEMKWFLS